MMIFLIMIEQRLVGCSGLNETVYQSISGRLPERKKEKRNDR